MHAILAEINHFAPLLKLHPILTEILLFESNINVISNAHKPKTNLNAIFVYKKVYKAEIFSLCILNELLFLLFHSYSRQETSMLSPEGLPMPNSVVYCKNKQGEKKSIKIN